MQNNHSTNAITRMARLAALSTGTALLILAAAAPAQADPPGSNGTIKIDGVDFDSHPNNQPHVGCTFQVDFYGFDEGDFDATVTFEAKAPTAGGVLLTDTVFIGEDSNDGAATPEGLDATKTYDLSEELAAIEPHPVQGHHVKLTIDAEGTQGNGSKHKVFWVEGCSPEEPPVEEPPVEEPPSVLPTAPQTPEVLGNVVTPQQLPRTGNSTGILAAAGITLLAVGTASKRLGVRLGGR